MNGRTLSDRAVIVLTMLAAIALAASISQAMFMQPTDAPVDRLIRNAEAYLKEHPRDANGHYVLGRIHYLAWSGRTGLVPVWRMPPDDKAELPTVVPDEFAAGAEYRARWSEAQRRALEEFKVDSPAKLSDDQRTAFWRRAQAIQQQLQKDKWTPGPVDPADLDQHAQMAVVQFRKAIELDPKNGLYHLGLASILDQYAARAEERHLSLEDVDPMGPAVDRPIEVEPGKVLGAWRAAALDQYREAFELTRTADAGLEHQPLTGIQSLVSHSAATGYLKLAERMDYSNDGVTVPMEAHLKKLADLPMGPITPIVFALEAHDGLAALLDGDATVAFDLDGTGRPQRWTWVKPDTGILVWDPLDRRQITSGRQLFGSVTWWLLPGDGYRAMDLLDDDRDGELAGAELRGLAVWFDRDQDGISDKSEVTPIAELPIAGLSVRPMSRDGDSPMHPAGLRLIDGRSLPTYDWLAEPAPVEGAPGR